MTVFLVAVISSCLLLKKIKKSTMADAKQGKTPLEDFLNGSSQSRVVLAKPRLGSFGGSSFASSSSKTCNPFGSVLRPSTLKPSSNPFLKVTEEEEKEKEVKEKTEDVEDRLQESDTKEEGEAPKFVPLGSTNVTTRTSNPVPTPAQPTASSSSSGFVFGQNLSERVVMQETLNNGEASSADHSSTNGTTELLFTSAAASVKDNQDEASTSDGQTGPGAGLAAAAAEYERSHARPPPPAASHSLTGEEDEVNVLQISCRLFVWEGGSWRERGRGVLRLNEAGRGGAGAGAGRGARLVVRVAGSLRVALNTKLWPDMVVERAGTKSLRITAADTQQQIKLYLIMGAPADIVQLHRALSTRVAQCKRNTNTPAAERLESQDFPQDHPADTPADKSDDTQTKTDDDHKTLKRKDPATDETSPKRQCPVPE